MCSTKIKYDLTNPCDLEEVRIILFKEDEEDDAFSDRSETDESDCIEEREGDSNSELSDTENEESCEQLDNVEYYTAFQKSNGQVIKSWIWKKTPFKKNEIVKHNLLVNSCGVIGEARNANSVIEAWKCFFDDTMLEQIVYCTNQYIDIQRGKFSRHRDARATDIIEIKAVIGLLYLAGIYHGNHLSLKELWDTSGYGIEKFRLVMSLKRFKFVVKCLRFDDRESRLERRALDRLAPIRDIFEKFVWKCKTSYFVSENVTIDEKLEGFYGKCNFKQYIPSKPRKYGIKMYAMVDSKLWYTSNMEIYIGKQPEGSPYTLSNKPADVVKRLSSPIHYTGRNITIDNWFCDVDLVEDLADLKLSVVGALKNNIAQIPQEFKNVSKRSVKSSLFGFRKNTTLVSYVPKPKKNVILISSLHDDDAIDMQTGDDRKPEIVTFYDSMKSIVDINYELCENYSVARNTKRWTLVVFFCLLNIGSVNAQVIFIENGNEVISRKMFLKQLADELVNEQLVRRCNNSTGIHMPLLEKIKKIVQVNDQCLHMDEEAKEGASDLVTVEPHEETLKKRKRCQPCQQNKKMRMTKYTCLMCGKYLCLQHCKNMCENCILRS